MTAEELREGWLYSLREGNVGIHVGRGEFLVLQTVREYEQLRSDVELRTMWHVEVPEWSPAGSIEPLYEIKQAPFDPKDLKEAATFNGPLSEKIVEFMLEYDRV